MDGDTFPGGATALSAADARDIKMGQFTFGARRQVDAVGQVVRRQHCGGSSLETPMVKLSASPTSIKLAKSVS
ncbi:hypothetical protein PC129_g7670 [Phytophthora cactorum]|uniref:Uncharacterized protein n=1 Tax=Phytophthora cactorum TaxID=29920 RepID=A0A329RF77_9STRA|nr:hypothetical protein Pcac1_g24371 [Phytophthora cactorum]KAG2817393.1 hypothetical protein PC112_g13071 [Phytophthora cactorum]KAG2819443.1 hypothetical protein PC111_g11889 [Phytophthora cactorum]KAG2854355.1 hypothetical protein PC113_g13386 [Phytophthora cactorum]KAG2898918.1 hypothetical protein PC114_g14091 [Phytophthora cactorum]